ncbi:RnfH family protein [Thiocapsa bogorovii]|uniref:RnfH family protein n=1 Tax=Thiocapsa bogorovii TaxID=521689 RepID=UPI001E2BBBAE|nr:RnfH family protein [Thiocapsa bogorovii]UHD15011.1 RnfH family protein [Thiocapsa bogorovii]
MVTDYLKVSVAYVGENDQVLRPLEVRIGATVRQAIEQSAVLSRCPEIDLAVNQVGIFGKLAKLDQVLEDGDRIEIYRPLIADPKEARKRRASEGKVMRKGGTDADSSAGT